MDTPADIAEALQIRDKMLGVLLRQARLKAGKTQKDCAAVLGYSPSVISAMEYGRRPITLPELEVLAFLFNIPVQTFWDPQPLSEETLPLPAPEVMLLRRKMIGISLRQARLAAKRGRQECAEALSIPADWISEYEYGERDIPLSHLEVLAEFLGVDLFYFLDDQATPRRQGERARAAMKRFSELSPDIQQFVLQPSNTLYLRIAMKLSSLSAETLRQIAEEILEITY